MTELSWYGWGLASKAYSLDRRPDAWGYLRTALDLSGDESLPVCAFDSISLPSSLLSDAQKSDLARLVGAENVKTDRRERVRHTYGKSYRDLVRLRQGILIHPPDAVVYPGGEDEVARLVEFCVRANCALVPFGGGSSVVGGVEAVDKRPVLSLDLGRMDRVLRVDEVSQTASVQAGIRGPALEQALNSRGFTLGHFPQSFEFSSLGGWIATRGAGLSSTKYGKIEAMVESLRAATPAGILETKRVPASAAGPSLLQLLVGSEGTLGVITSATMRIRPLPAVADYRALLFKSFPEGLAAVRQMLQHDLVPGTVRLSDRAETASFFSLRVASGGWREFYERLGLRWLGLHGYSFQSGALMILGLEGDGGAVRSERGRALQICKSHRGMDIGGGVARAWLADRYETPYLRDLLLDRGILTDTLETATTWDNLDHLHQELSSAIQAGSSAAGSRALVMTHVSHCYRDGASLYVTFLAKMARGHEIEQWQVIKRAASECIVANGGTISHHHGVGYEHMPWMKDELGRGGLRALEALKQALDPHNVMNPGKLISKEIR